MAEAHSGGRAGIATGSEEEKHLCSMGTGEIIYIFSYKALPGHLDSRCLMQKVAFNMYSCTAGITDCRVCHPQCGEVSFVLTFSARLTLSDLEMGLRQRLKAVSRV